MSFEYTFDGMNLTFDYVGNPADDPFGGRRGDFDTVTYVLSYDSVWMEGGNLIIELSSTVAYTGNFELNGSNDSTGAFKATQTIISVTEHLTGLRGVLSRVDTIGPVGLQVPVPGSFILMARSKARLVTLVGLTRPLHYP